MKNQPEPPPTPTEPYNRAAIFDQDGPFSPLFMRESVRTLFRALPLDQAEPVAWQHRRMYSALLGLSALHPRDEIEVMLGVQALSAYHAAAANWRIGMNLKKPNGDSTRHITTAANAARTFDAMLKAIERRQAKPLAIPVGRPAAKVWDEPHPTIVTTASPKTAARTRPRPNPTCRPPRKSSGPRKTSPSPTPSSPNASGTRKTKASISPTPTASCPAAA